jgi:poly-gamma-glutamate synthesis protein (capsule biosynthesis protein)
MTDIAHAAIDAGADVVMGHGPHYPLPVELYKDRPIFYGLGNLTFSTGHLGRKHAGWIGMMVGVTYERGMVTGCTFRFVRSDEKGASFFCRLADETETLADLAARSSRLGAALKPEGDRVLVTADE